MFAHQYTPLEHAYNAFLRLVRHLSKVREILYECASINLAETDWDIWDLDGMISDLRCEIEILEHQAQEAEKLWAPVQIQVSEAIGRLRVEVPDDSLTWSQFILDRAWRTWNPLDAQFRIHTDPIKIIESSITFRKRLDPFEDIVVWNARLTKEFRAGGIYEPKSIPNEVGKQPVESKPSASMLDGLVAAMQKSRKLKAVDRCEAELKDLVEKKIVDENWSQRELTAKLGVSSKTLGDCPTWIAWNAKK